MDIKKVQSREEWDSWFIDHGIIEFLQSWDWGEFQHQTGKEVTRLQLTDGEKVVEQVQGFTHSLGHGLQYWYAPRVMVSKKFLSAIKEFFQNRSFLFFRLEPLQSLRVPQAITVKNRQPPDTLILSLRQSATELFGRMHPKTRYNIRLAEKKGVEVREEKNIELFLELNEQTTKRDGFKSHNREYYSQMLSFDFVHQFNAFYGNQFLATLLLIIFGTRATYVHGASSAECRNLMAPYLLQAQAIEYARGRGCHEYDFWGIAPPALPAEANILSFHGLEWQGNHRFSGVTRFKAGFGGTVIHYPSAMEIPLQKWKYQGYRFLRYLKEM